MPEGRASCGSGSPPSSCSASCCSTPPLLAIFNIEYFVFGIPLLYAYLFGVWLALIALVAVAIERTGGDGMPPEPAPTGEARREG